MTKITVAHGGASGVAFAWVQQLLNSGEIVWYQPANGNLVDAAQIH